jgi:DNA-binding beta-propeller fold protein YncE
VSTLAGSGTAGGVNGIGTNAQFFYPTDTALDSSGTMGYVVEQDGNRVRSIVLATASVSTLAGSGVAGFADGTGVAALFNAPTSAVWHPNGTLFVAGWLDNRVRRINIATATVSTLAGNGAAGGSNGVGTAATFNEPRGVALDATFSTLYVAEYSGHRIRSIDLSTALVQTVAGSGASGFVNSFGVAAVFNRPIFIASSPSGMLYTADYINNRIRQLTCVPCPASYYCSSGAPVLCPAGSYCPLSSVNPTPCPAGTWSAAGAASCIPCSAGSYSSVPGAAAPFTCTPCSAGTYSAASGAPSSAVCLPCAAGSYSAQGATSCPFTVATCPVGSYANGTAACAPCSPATACTVPGLSAQPPCYWNVSTTVGSGIAGFADGSGGIASFN